MEYDPTTGSVGSGASAGASTDMRASRASGLIGDGSLAGASSTAAVIAPTAISAISSERLIALRFSRPRSFL